MTARDVEDSTLGGHRPPLQWKCTLHIRLPRPLAADLLRGAIVGSVANWVLFFIDCIVLPLMIRAEERELLNRCGNEFVDYMSRAPRFPKMDMVRFKSL